MIDGKAIGQEVINLIADEWEKQGHNMTGAFTAAMTAEAIEEGNSITINIYDNTRRSYGVILDDGVAPDRIPFSPGSGRKTSKYIAALARYAQARMGASDKDALSIAFAIAYKHKAEGMPTQASSRFSQTGRRTGFVADATQQIDEVVSKYVNDAILI